MITPEMLAKCGSEHAHQTALFCWAALPETKELLGPEIDLMFAIPNGGLRSKRVAANLKAEGVKAGILDIFLPVPRGEYHGLFIEMKIAPNKITPEQALFGQRVTAQGYRCCLCYSWYEAKMAILSYFGKSENKY